MTARVSRPICQSCGNQRGPWVPAEGFRDETGGQVWRCAPGSGCNTVEVKASVPESATARVTRRAREAVEASGRTYGDIAAKIGMTAAELTEQVIGDTADPSVAILLCLAEEIGADLVEWFRPESETVLVDHAELVDYVQSLPSDSDETPATDAPRNEYDARIARWSDRLAAAVLSLDQAQGIACVACGHNPLTATEPSRPMVVVGYGKPGVSSHLFACTDCDETQGGGR